MAYRLLSSLALLGLLSCTAVAQAADMAAPTAPAEAPIIVAPSWYIAARAGVALPESTEFGFLGSTINTDYNTSFVGGLAIGTQFNLGGFTPRGEIEVGYMRGEVDSHSVDGVEFGGDNSFGHAGVLYGLLNGYFDFGNGPLKPYVGAGLGFGSVQFDNQGVNIAGVPLTALDDSATGFAWQVGAGLSYAFNTNATVELGYRYFSVENVGVTAVDGTDSDVDVSANQIMLGFRYAF